MPHTYSIHGLDVEFPHEAYPCQIEYMQKVISALKRVRLATHQVQGHPCTRWRALQRPRGAPQPAPTLPRSPCCALAQKENALLESPTGTGKTLCLLCATLAWREAHLKVSGRWVLPPSVWVGGGGGAGVPWPTTCAPARPCMRHAPPPQELKSKEGGQPAGPFAEPPPLIIYASRTHSQLAQVIKELRNTKYRRVAGQRSSPAPPPASTCNSSSRQPITQPT